MRSAASLLRVWQRTILTGAKKHAATSSGSTSTTASLWRISAIGPINVLMIPVGGGLALNGSQAVEVIRLIEPAIVIPMHYATPGSDLPLEPLNNFLAEMGVSSVEELDTLIVNQAATPSILSSSSASLCQGLHGWVSSRQKHGLRSMGTAHRCSPAASPTVWSACAVFCKAANGSRFRGGCSS